MELWNEALVTPYEGQSRRKLSHLRLSANTEMLRTACFLCVIGHRELLNTHQDLLWKFSIPTSEKFKVLRRLDLYNLNAFSLFSSEESLMQTMALREFHFRPMDR